MSCKKKLIKWCFSPKTAPKGVKTSQLSLDKAFVLSVLKLGLWINLQKQKPENECFKCVLVVFGLWFFKVPQPKHNPRESTVNIKVLVKGEIVN